MSQQSSHVSQSEIYRLAQELGAALLHSSLTVSTAESCTGGLVAAAITEVPGSSAWFERSVVTYSNAAKQDLLGVQQLVFDTQGAVSESCVLAMAQGLIACTGADLAVSVSGIAGPGGGTEEKPVGTVWIAWAFPSAGKLDAQRFQCVGGRHAIRQQAVREALRGTIKRL